MKKLLCSFLFILTSISAIHAQQFISINPNFGLKGQTISTVVTGSDFYFTWGTTPTTWGDFYMDQNGTQILPSSITVIDDDHLDVVWPIPSNTPIGNYSVVWENYVPWGGNYASVPGGFDVDCVSPPAQIAPASQYFCAGGSAVLQANIGAGLTYQWYNGIAAIAGAVNSTLTVTTGGNYKVRVSNAQGCPRFSDAVLLYPTALPLATISPATNQLICQGNSINLTANTGGYYTYQWYKNGNIMNGITTKVISVNTSGSYSVQVTNYYGCTKLSNPVAISYATQPPSYVTASGSLTICAGSSVTLKTSTGTGYTYQWYKYGNAISGATNRTLDVASAGAYKVQVTNAGGCTKKSGAKIVSVDSAPPATITPQGPLTFCPGDSVILNANAGPGYSYAWKKYGNIITGATSSSYKAKTAGPYKVIVTNSNGCSKVSQAKTVTIIVCRESISAALVETDLFPNPATDQIQITGENLSKIEILSSEGKVVRSFNLQASQIIDISELPLGIYMAVIYSEKEVLTKRFVKQ